ncbi:hypothetical protein HN51_051566, partial [Arachis hypogaea]
AKDKVGEGQSSKGGGLRRYAVSLLRDHPMHLHLIAEHDAMIHHGSVNSNLEP